MSSGEIEDKSNFLFRVEDGGEGKCFEKGDFEDFDFFNCFFFIFFCLRFSCADFN